MQQTKTIFGLKHEIACHTTRGPNDVGLQYMCIANLVNILGLTKLAHLVQLSCIDPIRIKLVDHDQIIQKMSTGLV